MKTLSDSQSFGGYIWRKKHTSHGDEALGTSLIEDRKKEVKIRTTWHYHIIMQSMSSVSCHVLSWVIMCHIIIVDYIIIYSKCIVKWNSKGHIQNMKIHVKSKSHRKSNSHGGSQRVTRKVKCHLLVIYTPSLYEKRDFHLGSSTNAFERQFSTFEEKVVAPMLHYWS